MVEAPTEEQAEASAARLAEVVRSSLGADRTAHPA
jgi:hypothetical protein